MRRTKKLYTIIRANNGEVVASDVTLGEAFRIVGGKFETVIIQKAEIGATYRGFRIIQKDNPVYARESNVKTVTVQLDNGEFKDVPFDWVWQRVQEQKGNFRKKVQHGKQQKSSNKET